MNSHTRPPWLDWGVLCAVLGVLTLALLVLGLGVGSTGWHSPLASWQGGPEWQILWDIRLPRTLGAWLVGALLGLAGAVAQGLFRNPLAEPYLLGSSSGAALAVALSLVLLGHTTLMSDAGWGWRFGLTGAAFVGAVGGVLLTLFLARGAAHTMRLLLAGVVVGVVLGALTSLLMVWSADVWRAMQTFMLGNTGLLGWPACGVLLWAWLMVMPIALMLSRVLDALTLGEDTVRSLGIPLGWARTALVAVLALATAAAVAQAGLVAFVGLAAPHLVRRHAQTRHAALLLASSLMGGVLLQAADVLARWLIAPQEIPVGVLTAVLGGGYLLWLMHRRVS
ncbi:MAG: iron ABC transporter permease [Burkholderiales bacterium]|nr:iron ABC transporter permease [Burkholderiales bacterium]